VSIKSFCAVEPDGTNEDESAIRHWALAIKTKLGNVYHLCYGDAAHCDYRIRLEPRKYEVPPDDGYVCGRCRRFVRAND